MISSSVERVAASKRDIAQLDLAKIHDHHRGEFLEAIERVISSGEFIGGAELLKFEKDFAQWTAPGSYVTGCANGTDAITLAARAMGIQPGKEAIVPAMTYIATASGLRHAGLRVRLVDVIEGSWLMDPQQLSKAIGPNTALIVPVHLYGQMPPMDEIREIADKNRCQVLEDASQAQGAQWKEKPVGFWSDVATFSFYPGKNLGAMGDAGAILSREKKTVDKAKALGNHGGLQKYSHEWLGYNSRLDNLQAAVLNVKLKYLSEWNDVRQQRAKLYLENLCDLKELRLPFIHPDASHVFHQFVVLVEDRESFIAHLRSHGIGTGIHYPKALNQLPALEGEIENPGRFPVAEKLARLGVSLPMGPTLSQQDCLTVCKVIRNYFQ